MGNSEIIATLTIVFFARLTWLGLPVKSPAVDHIPCDFYFGVSFRNAAEKNDQSNLPLSV